MSSDASNAQGAPTPENESGTGTDEAGTVEFVSQCMATAARLRALSPSTVTRPAFVYLDIIGLGWPCRAALSVAGVEFDDIRVPLAVWMGMRARDFVAGTRPLPYDESPKAATRTKHVPFYCDQEVELQHSTVILRYIGRKHGLWCDPASASPLDELRMEEVLAHTYDMLFHYTGIFQHNQKALYGMKPEAYHRAQLEQFNAEHTGGYHKNLLVLQQYLEANAGGGGFFIGNRLTVADLSAFSVLTFWYKLWAPDVFVEHFPLLEAYIQRIADIPAVAAYNTKRCRHTWVHGDWGTLGHCAKYADEHAHCGLAKGIM